RLTTVKYKYGVVNADNPEDRFVRQNWGEALDWGDKGLNKCSTIAEKVFLLRLFKIATHDDPDAHSVQKPQNRPASLNGDKGRGNRTSELAPNECQDCHIPISKARRDNKTWYFDEQVAVSMKEFGRRLCVDCLLKARARATRKSSPSSGSATANSAHSVDSTSQAQEPDAVA